ncbi:MAG: response regulator [Planctomycetota bacterium]
MVDIRVLVIDDNAESLQIIRDTLEANGYGVETATDGEIGLNKVRFAVKQGKPYTLCVTDVMLPKISGIDLLKRAREASPTTGVLVITAFDEVDPFIKKEALTYGAFAFMPKPIQPANLLAVIRDHLLRKRIAAPPSSAIVAPPGSMPFFGNTPAQRKTQSYTRQAATFAPDLPPPPPDMTVMPAGLPPPPPPDEGEHITRPVPDEKHFQDITGPADIAPRDGDFGYTITKCPMCTQLIKIANDQMSGKIWCSSCGILFDKVDVDVNREIAAMEARHTAAQAPPGGRDAASTVTPPPFAAGREDALTALAPQERKPAWNAAAAPAAPVPAPSTEEVARAEYESVFGVAPAAPAPPFRILIVEDDQHAAEILQTALDVAGYAADVATTGDQGLAAMHASVQGGTPYTMVVSDVMLPGLNGLDLMRQVKASYPTVDFVLVSAYEDEKLSLQKQAQAEGALAFFSKPYDYKELIRFIAQLRTGGV